MELRWLAEQTPSNGTPLCAASLVRRGELVELSPPPFLPLARCPHHQRRFSWLLVRTPTTAGGRTNQHINISTHQLINPSTHQPLLRLPQRHIQHHHHNKSPHKSKHRYVCIFITLCFRNDFLYYHIDHGSSGKGQRKR